MDRWQFLSRPILRVAVNIHMKMEAILAITNSIAVNERTCFQDDASGNRLTQVFMRANHRVDGRKTTPTVGKIERYYLSCTTYHLL